MDGFTLYAVVRELSDELAGAKIEKIHMPARDEAHFLFRRGRRLKVNVNSSDYRIHLSEHGGKYPQTPFPMCMYLRKHLTGAVITGVTMPGLERIVRIDLDARDELGDSREIRMYVELMGRHSNLIFTDGSNVILECFKHISLSESAKRPMLPGLVYEYPQSAKADPLNTGEEEMARLIMEQGDKPLYAKLSAAFAGLSNRTAQEVVDAALPVYTAPIKLDMAEARVTAAKLHRFFAAFKDGGWSPHIAGSGYSVFPRRLTGMRTFTTANEMMDAYWQEKQQAAELTNRRRGLLKTLKRHIERREKRMAIYNDTMKEAAEADALRMYADLITANLYKLSRNVSSVTVEDYFNDLRPVTIPLDEKYSPAVNARRYYKKYAKLKTAAELTRGYIASTQAELDYLYEVEYAVEACEQTDELSEIAFELHKYGYMDKPPQKRPTDEVSAPLRLRSSEGYDIYVGRNSRQNDRLTMRDAAPGDLWLHAKGPGSHVILKLNGADIPDVSLLEAAAVAAYYSKQRGADKAAVDYTYRRNIKKAPGAKPGLVLYDTYYTVNVAPDGELAERLRVKGDA